MPGMEQTLLKAALAGLEFQRSRLDEQITVIRSAMDGNGTGVVEDVVEEVPPVPLVDHQPGKRKMTAAFRKKMSRLMKERWAKARRQQRTRL